jgi:quercetin dioxygenase-like cupin family protein
MRTDLSGRGPNRRKRGRTQKAGLVSAFSAPSAVLLLCAFGAGSALAQGVPALPREAMGLDPKYDVQMMVFDTPPAAAPNPTTKGMAGHKHPGSTYAYVVSGEVISRLGDGPEKHFKAGEAWSETPGQAHYIVNASTTTPARVVVVFVVPKSAAQLSEPLK